MKSPLVSLSKTAINLVPLIVVTPVIPAEDGRSVSPDPYKEPNSQDNLERYDDHRALAPETRHFAPKIGVNSGTPQRYTYHHVQLYHSRKWFEDLSMFFRHR